MASSPSAVAIAAAVLAALAIAGCSGMYVPPAQQGGRSLDGLARVPLFRMGGGIPMPESPEPPSSGRTCVYRPPYGLMCATRIAPPASEDQERLSATLGRLRDLAEREGAQADSEEAEQDVDRRVLLVRRGPEATDDDISGSDDERPAPGWLFGSRRTPSLIFPSDPSDSSPSSFDDPSYERRTPVLVTRRVIVIPRREDDDQDDLAVREQAVRNRINALRAAFGLPPLPGNDDETSTELQPTDSRPSNVDSSSEDAEDTPTGQRRVVVIQGRPRISHVDSEGIHFTRPTLVMSVPVGQDSSEDAEDPSAAASPALPSHSHDDDDDDDQTPRFEIPDSRSGADAEPAESDSTPDDGDDATGKRRIVVIQGAPRITHDSEGYHISRPTLILSVPADQDDAKDTTESSEDATTTPALATSTEDDDDVALDNRAKGYDTSSRAPVSTTTTYISTSPTTMKPTTTEAVTPIGKDERTNSIDSNDDEDSDDSSSEETTMFSVTATSAPPTTTTQASQTITTGSWNDDDDVLTTTTEVDDLSSREQLDLSKEVEWLKKRRTGGKPERQVAGSPEERKKYFEYDVQPHAMTV